MSFEISNLLRGDELLVCKQRARHPGALVAAGVHSQQPSNRSHTNICKESNFSARRLAQNLGTLVRRAENCRSASESFLAKVSWKRNTRTRGIGLRTIEFRSGERAVDALLERSASPITPYIEQTTKSPIARVTKPIPERPVPWRRQPRASLYPRFWSSSARVLRLANYADVAGHVPAIMLKTESHVMTASGTNFTGRGQNQ